MKITEIKFLFFFLLTCGCIVSSAAQNPEVLNNYQFIFLPQLIYNQGKNDIYDIRKTIAEKLDSCGVPLFLEENQISSEAMKNPCAMIHCIIGNSQSSGNNLTLIKVLFLDCKNDTVLSSYAQAEAHRNFQDTRESFIRATRKAIEIFNGYGYHFTGSRSPEPDVKTETTDDDSITWSLNRKLTWGDFKGKALDDDPADALTYTANQTIFEAFGIGNRFSVESKVTCHFIKTMSWVKAGKESDYLLNHEQRHFDLAEAGAREFRLKLREAQFNNENFNRQVKKIKEEITDKYNKLQEQYDSETSHSRIEEKQKEWNVRIDRMLKESEGYK